MLSKPTLITYSLQQVLTSYTFSVLPTRDQVFEYQSHEGHLLLKTSQNTYRNKNPHQNVIDMASVLSRAL